MSALPPKADITERGGGERREVAEAVAEGLSDQN
jgi:hypothetical protein